MRPSSRFVRRSCATGLREPYRHRRSSPARSFPCTHVSAWRLKPQKEATRRARRPRGASGSGNRCCTASAHNAPRPSSGQSSPSSEKSFSSSLTNRRRTRSTSSTRSGGSGTHSPSADQRAELRGSPDVGVSARAQAFQFTEASMKRNHWDRRGGLARTCWHCIRRRLGEGLVRRPRPRAAESDEVGRPSAPGAAEGGRPALAREGAAGDGEQGEQGRREPQERRLGGSGARQVAAGGRELRATAHRRRRRSRPSRSCSWRRHSSTRTRRSSGSTTGKHASTRPRSASIWRTSSSSRRRTRR